MSETARESGMNRAALLKTAGGAGAAIAFGGLVAASTARASGLTTGDVDILIAAEIAEALAVTTYTGSSSRRRSSPGSRTMTRAT